MSVPRVFSMAVGPFFGTRFALARLAGRWGAFNGAVTRRLFDGDEMVMVPKAGASVRQVDLDVDISIDGAGDSTVLPGDVVEELIGRAEGIFIMDFCLCRRSNRCKDYPVEYGCIFMGKGTSRIPSDLGHLATREEALEHLRACREAGLVNIIGRNKLDSVWLGIGDKRDLMTVCNCCPCCCLWNMVRDTSDEISGSLRRMRGVSVAVDAEACAGCGDCVPRCFVRAVSMDGGRAVIDPDVCRGCGRCAEACSEHAISVVFDGDAAVEEVDRIASLVDLRSDVHPADGALGRE